MAIGVNPETPSALGVTTNTNPGVRRENAPVRQDDAAQAGAVGRRQDQSAFYDLSQGSTGIQGSLTAVTAGLNRANSVSDSAFAALDAITTFLNTASELADEASADTYSADQRETANTQLQMVFAQIEISVANAAFDGVNLLDGSMTDGLLILDAVNGSGEVRLPGFDLTLGSDSLQLSGEETLLTTDAASRAQTALQQAQVSIAEVWDALTGVTKQVSAHGDLVARALESTSLEADIEPDLAVEGALLTALQVQQGLAAGQYSIANTGSQQILALFRQS